MADQKSLPSDIKLTIQTCDGQYIKLWYSIWSKFGYFHNIIEALLKEGKVPNETIIEMALTSGQIKKIIDLINNKRLVTLYRNYKGVNAYLQFNDMGIEVVPRLRALVEKKEIKLGEKIRNITNTPQDWKIWFDMVEEFNKAKYQIDSSFVPDDHWPEGVMQIIYDDIYVGNDKKYCISTHIEAYRCEYIILKYILLVEQRKNIMLQIAVVHCSYPDGWVNGIRIINKNQYWNPYVETKIKKKGWTRFLTEED